MTDDPFLAHRSLLFTAAYELLGSAADVAPAARRPIAGWGRVANALSRFAELAPGVDITTPRVNGAVAARIDPGGEFDTAVTFVVEDGRITRMYAMRNPHKLGRLDAVAELRR